MSFIDSTIIDLSKVSDDTTVEEYLKMLCEEEIKRIQEHSDELVENFKKDANDVKEKLIQKLNNP